MNFVLFSPKSPRIFIIIKLNSPEAKHIATEYPYRIFYKLNI